MLKRTVPTLPASYYFEPQHHAREIDLIWSREWLCVGHASEFSEPGEYRVYRLAEQQIVVVRSSNGALNAFHNTCRHRGSQLCIQSSGTFRGERIVCPYHGWGYSLDGKLQQTPRRLESDDFDPADYALYPVSLETWRGFVFINLAKTPARSLQDALCNQADIFGNWPLEELCLAHQEVQQVACNWKIFWENYAECLHCPMVHKDLSKLVPLYGRGLTSLNDLPDDSPLKNSGAYLADGMETWSRDGRTPLPRFAGLTAGEQSAGMTFAEFLPAVFIVGHVDYLRSVHVLPLGPEMTQLTVNWLLPSNTLKTGDVDIERLVCFARQVVQEDQQVCEMNQRGLHCSRHRNGVLLPQEYDVLSFDNWVRERLGEPLEPAE